MTTNNAIKHFSIFVFEYTPYVSLFIIDRESIGQLLSQVRTDAILKARLIPTQSVVISMVQRIAT